MVVTHLGLATFAADARPELALGTSSRMLRFSSASFDASIFEMLQAFSAGAAMVVAPPHVLGGDELVDVLRTAPGHAHRSRRHRPQHRRPADCRTVEAASR
ncbi:hypothetical protein NJ76_10150, partial [Rhodococcus sp. IITR03]